MQFHALQITAFYSYKKILLFINKVFLTEIHLCIDTFTVNQKHTWDTYLPVMTGISITFRLLILSTFVFKEKEKECEACGK